MIFAIQGHIGMIRVGTKTQTRRVNRGIYQVGKDYAVQSKRGMKAEPDIRIVMDRIWEEEVSKPNIFFTPITKENALVEGGYTSEEYEKVFQELNPKWSGWDRWTFEFHVIEVQRK